MCLQGCLTAPNTFERQLEGNLTSHIGRDRLGTFIGIFLGMG